MSETKWTPGPWWFGKSDVENGLVFSIEPDVLFGCGCCGSPNLKLKDANLISAAPDMVDALNQWRHAEETGDDVELANAQKSRDMAIAKARGETDEYRGEHR